MLTAGILGTAFSLVFPTIRLSQYSGFFSQYNILTDTLPVSVNLNYSEKYLILIENNENIEMQTDINISLIQKDVEVTIKYDCDDGGCSNILSDWRIPSTSKGNVYLNLTIGKNPLYDNYTINITVWEKGRKNINYKNINHTFFINQEKQRKW